MDTMKIPDVRKRWLSAITKAQQNPEQKALLSQLCKERCKNPDHMQKRADGQKRFLDTLDDSEKKQVIDRMKTPEAKAKRVKALRATLSTAIGKQNHGNATRASWKDPETRARRMESLQKAAAQRRKPKPVKIPYDKERRAEAMRASWLKRKGLTV